VETGQKRANLKKILPLWEHESLNLSGDFCCILLVLGAPHCQCHSNGKREQAYDYLL
jgi:hypothetical protein